MATLHSQILCNAISTSNSATKFGSQTRLPLLALVFQPALLRQPDLLIDQTDLSPFLASMEALPPAVAVSPSIAPAPAPRPAALASALASMLRRLHFGDNVPVHFRLLMPKTLK
jgi:hypothetical protein